VRERGGLTHLETNMKNESHWNIYIKSHQIASSIEESIFGYCVIDDRRQGLDMTFTERDGSTTRQVVELQEKMKDGSLKPLNPNKPIRVKKTKGK
jgi:hypothetical protein